MTESEIRKSVEAQKEYFRRGETLDVSWRIEQLKKLKQAVEKNEDALKESLYKDLGRSPTEAYFCDIGAVLAEINESIRGTRRWARRETHFSGFVCFPSIITHVSKMPYGTCLIISPFNFPVMLSLGVLAACISGGNTAVIKLSSKSPATTSCLKKIIAETFPPEYVTVIDGGHDIADICLSQRFDKIFYTGSPKIGRHVLALASDNLTPVALELGGETGNWCIVRADADIRDAAEKIAFFKACNSGQICININQIAVASAVADEFLSELKAAFSRQLGEHASENPEYARLIDRKKYDTVSALAEKYSERTVFGGRGNPDTLQFDPTIIYPVDADEEIATHEHFSPLLPVIPFEDSDVDSLLGRIADREHGLALYLFTKDIRWADRVMSTMQFGGGCINEVCLHMMVKGVPFNGTGHSGMGAYHGEWGFREFTHPCTVLKGSTCFNLPLRNHPYGGKYSWKEKIIRIVER